MRGGVEMGMAVMTSARWGGDGYGGGEEWEVGGDGYGGGEECDVGGDGYGGGEEWEVGWRWVWRW